MMVMVMVGVIWLVKMATHVPSDVAAPTVALWWPLDVEHSLLR